MYICRDCKGYFTTPSKFGDGFPHAFGVERYSSELCPYCESTDYDYAVECPKCGRDMKLPEDKLCTGCRLALFRKVAMFFDELIAEEEEQFDEWFDGISVSDRRSVVVDELLR